MLEVRPKRGKSEEWQRKWCKCL